MEISSPRNEKLLSPSSNGEADAGVTANGFVTARTELEMDVRQKRGLAVSPNASSPQNDGSNRGYGVKSYGSGRGLRGFVPPIRSTGGNSGNVTSRASKGDDSFDDSTKKMHGSIMWYRWGTSREVTEFRASPYGAH